MLQKLLQHRIQIFFCAIAVIGFALIRNYEHVLFYDPLLLFFKGEYSGRQVPQIVEWKFYLSLLFRYFLNSLLSVFIIYILFKNNEHVKLAALLFVIFFLVLILLFWIVWNYFNEHVMAIFYVRRFIIQPIFLLLFIPGFYFQQEQMKKGDF